MRINHLILGTLDLEATADFYIKILEYKRRTTFTDTGTGQQGLILTHEDGPTLLMVPFVKERLPSPQHIAFEVDEELFKEIQVNCTQNKINTRSLPNLDAAQGGPVKHEELGEKYQHFYFCDPNNINLEIMTTAF